LGALPDVAKSFFERSVIAQRLERYAEAVDDLERAQAVFARLEMPL
jgi:hypothetical protein